MAEASLAAFAVRADEKYLLPFWRAHRWFLGQNSLGQSLAEPDCGACFDGLQPGGVNRNQGAESTLAYLWTELLSFTAQPALAVNPKEVVAGL